MSAKKWFIIFGIVVATTGSLLGNAFVTILGAALAIALVIK
mgnify:CR=1 FL=1